MVLDELLMTKRMLPLRLQFFADEGADKTEEATPKKLSDARKEGQVAKSQEVTTAVMLLALFVILKVAIGYVGERLMRYFSETYQVIDVYAVDSFTPALATAFLRDGLVEVLLVCLPMFAVAVAVAFIVNVYQVKCPIFFILFL